MLLTLDTNKSVIDQHKNFQLLPSVINTLRLQEISRKEYKNKVFLYNGIYSVFDILCNVRIIENNIFILQINLLFSFSTDAGY